VTTSGETLDRGHRWTDRLGNRLALAVARGVVRLHRRWLRQVEPWASETNRALAEDAERHLAALERAYADWKRRGGLR
jgi:hypothetical protein